MYRNFLKLKKSKQGTGNGVFTDIDIPAESPIMEMTGNVYTKETMPEPNHPALLQVSNKYFIGPSGTIDDYVNHSCDPNCYLHIVGKRAILYSLYFIREGSELTFDYSTTSTETMEEWSMECFCKSFKCRKIISGYQYLPESLKKEYENKGMIPMYICNPYFKRI